MAVSPSHSTINQGVWTQDEHDMFLQALRQYPQGPWKSITEFIGTRSVRQVQTHAQKYNEKVVRRLRGSQKDRKTWARLEHRVDDEVPSFCSKRPGAVLQDASESAEAALSETGAQTLEPSLESFEDSDDAALREVLAWSSQTDLVFSADDSSSSLTALPSLEESLDFLIKRLLDA
ncbi:unnamed protein product [Globisporangium polare]